MNKIKLNYSLEEFNHFIKAILHYFDPSEIVDLKDKDKAKLLNVFKIFKHEGLHHFFYDYLQSNHKKMVYSNVKQILENQKFYFYEYSDYVHLSLLNEYMILKEISKEDALNELGVGDEKLKQAILNNPSYLENWNKIDFLYQQVNNLMNILIANDNRDDYYTLSEKIGYVYEDLDEFELKQYYDSQYFILIKENVLDMIKQEIYSEEDKQYLISVLNILESFKYKDFYLLYNEYLEDELVEILNRNNQDFQSFYKNIKSERFFKTESNLIKTIEIFIEETISNIELNDRKIKRLNTTNFNETISTDSEMVVYVKELMQKIDSLNKIINNPNLNHFMNFFHEKIKLDTVSYAFVLSSIHIVPAILNKRNIVMREYEKINETSLFEYDKINDDELKHDENHDILNNNETNNIMNENENVKVNNDDFDLNHFITSYDNDNQNQENHQAENDNTSNQNDDLVLNNNENWSDDVSDLLAQIDEQTPENIDNHQNTENTHIDDVAVDNQEEINTNNNDDVIENNDNDNQEVVNEISENNDTENNVVDNEKEIDEWQFFNDVFSEQYSQEEANNILIEERKIFQSEAFVKNLNNAVKLDYDEDTYAHLKRNFHSVKGDLRFVGLTNISESYYLLEKLFEDKIKKKEKINLAEKEVIEQINQFYDSTVDGLLLDIKTVVPVPVFQILKMLSNASQRKHLLSNYFLEENNILKQPDFELESVETEKEQEHKLEEVVEPISQETLHEINQTLYSPQEETQEEQHNEQEVVDDVDNVEVQVDEVQSEIETNLMPQEQVQEEYEETPQQQYEQDEVPVDDGNQVYMNRDVVYVNREVDLVSRGVIIKDMERGGYVVNGMRFVSVQKWGEFVHNFDSTVKMLFNYNRDLFERLPYDESIMLDEGILSAINDLIEMTYGVGLFKTATLLNSWQFLLRFIINHDISYDGVIGNLNDMVLRAVHGLVIDHEIEGNNHENFEFHLASIQNTQSYMMFLLNREVIKQEVNEKFKDLREGLYASLENNAEHLAGLKEKFGLFENTFNKFTLQTDKNFKRIGDNLDFEQIEMLQEIMTNNQNKTDESLKELSKYLSKLGNLFMKAHPELNKKNKTTTQQTQLQNNQTEKKDKKKFFGLF